MVRKTFLFFLQLLFLIIIGAFFIHSSAFASVNCTLNAPIQIQASDTNVPFEIDSSDLTPGNYDVVVGANTGGVNSCAVYDYSYATIDTCFLNQNSVPLTDHKLKFNSGPSWEKSFNAGDKLWVDVYVHGELSNTGTTSQPICNHGMNFLINQTVLSGQCIFNFTPPESTHSWTPSTDIKLNIDMSKTGYPADEDHRIELRGVNGNQYDKGWTNTTTDMNGHTYDLGTLASGQYKVMVGNNPSGPFTTYNPECLETITVNPQGGGLVAEQGGSFCQVCAKGTHWAKLPACINDPTIIADCCLNDADNTKQSALQITCGAGSVCDPLHRSQDQSAADGSNPTGCLPIASYGSSPYSPAPSPLCSSYSSDGKCAYIDSGLGINLPTDASGLIKALMGIVLSLVGAIAIILIIISGYRLMVSQGNPEGIKNAKDQLTAAIIGLLFVIFSLVILQVIGYNILGLPGFGQ